MTQQIYKIIATIVMVVDHLGWVFHVTELNLIGRLAFPMFAYMFAQHKHNPRKILLVACLSQLPYSLLLNRTDLNIFFLFYASTFLSKSKIDNFTIGLISQLFIGYGAYGLFLTTQTNRIYLALAHLLSYWIVAPMQVISILAPTHYIKAVQKPKKFEKNFYYCFYPVHLWILLILKNTI